MKGVNSFHLNQATMVAALQTYLDAQFMPSKAPKVLDVEPAPLGDSFIYIVKTDEKVPSK